ncbi:MAG: 3-terminal phosphate cyclase [Planctomycetaceae bacterium]|nr:3-terminal phosphate cyclase [Planctomycetaceae bacterium]
MLEIDGSMGEGGGQILRTSVALSILTQTPIRITRIRAGREKPGLQRQHLVAVQAAARVSNAEITGDELQSSELTFRPNQVTPGVYRFSTGSAGSTTLVLQTLLPVLWSAQGPSRLTLEGGTHNPFAPPFDFLANAFIPMLERMGPRIGIRLDRHGFYPRGGGSIDVEITPSAKLQPISLVERGPRLDFQAEAVVVGLSKDIADREVATLRRHLNWPGDQIFAKVHPDRFGVGNYIAVTLKNENVCEVQTAIGQRGVRGEDMARLVAKQVQRHLCANVPVGEYLADQLLLPMALAGKGEFVTLTPSLHTTTNIEIIQKFLNVKFDVVEFSPDRFRISVCAR